MLDEKAANTAHVAIGNNLGPYGGDNAATIHVDCVFSVPELAVDGRPAGEIPPLEAITASFVDGVGTIAQLPGTSFYRRLREKFGRLAS